LTRRVILHRASDTVVRDKTGTVLYEEPPKGRTFEKRRRPQPECINGITDGSLKEEMPLRSKGIFHDAFEQIIGLEVGNRAVESYFRIRKLSVRALWRSWLSPK
jgi:hypothetical protein